MRILFVDDEPPVLNLLQTLFRHASPEWESAFTDRGAKALELMEQQPFDAIVSDMRMPEMSGAELLEQVRDRYPRTARIILSGYADHSMSSRSLGAAHQYLSKPFTLAGLQSALNHVFNARLYLENPILQQAFGGLHLLPSAPSLLQRFTREVASPSATVETLAGWIAQDIAMTARILQIVHSAFFGPPRPFTLAKECAQALGLNLLRSLAVSHQINRASDSGQVGGLDLDNFSNHGVAVGLRATRIMSLEKATPNAVKLSFTAGLLSGIGRLVLATVFPEKHAEATAQAAAGTTTLHRAELETCGADHAQTGAFLLGLWGLPKNVVQIVAHAHQPSKTETSGFSPLTAVHVAQHLEFTSLDVPETAIPPLDETHLDALKIDSARLRSWAEVTTRSS